MELNIERFLGISDIAKTVNTKDILAKAKSLMAKKKPSDYAKLLKRLNIRHFN